MADTMANPRVRVGQGDYQYEVNVSPVQRPAEFTWLEVAAVAVDSRDRVYVFNRGEHPVMVFDRDGTFLHAWGEGPVHPAARHHHRPRRRRLLHRRPRPHRPQVHARGRLLLTLGHQRQAVRHRRDEHRLPHDPPRRAAVSLSDQRGPLRRNGEIYVSDGYGNARVHRFSPDGRLLRSWGEPGSGPGQFHLPHGIAVDRRRDRLRRRPREQPRAALHAPRASIVDEWTDVARPCQVSIDRAGSVFVAELGFRAGMWPGRRPRRRTPPAAASASSTATASCWPAGAAATIPRAPGDFFAPHDICVDSRGDVYVAEVVMSAGGNRGLVSPDCHTPAEVHEGRPEAG